MADTPSSRLMNVPLAAVTGSSLRMTEVERPIYDEIAYAPATDRRLSMPEWCAQDHFVLDQPGEERTPGLESGADTALAPAEA